ncbi:MAG TPA: hypothetical protein VGL13_18490, partial [Polyangiaceae bacterium]
KGELAGYYESIAAAMVPHLRGRPITMERYPAGIDHEGFIQKDVSKGFPEWLKRVEVPKKGGTSWYPLVGDTRSLLWIANQNCITPHVWVSHLPDLDKPDLCVFDLDPSRDDAAELRAATLEVRGLIEELGLVSWVKTSGSKGFHIVIPLDGEAAFDTVWEFGQTCGALLVKRNPARFTQQFLKVDREGRILVDTGRNGYGATFAAVYAVRPKRGAPISAPCTWSEVESGAATPQAFALRTMARRMDDVGDLWAKLHDRGQSLNGALEKLRPLLTDEERSHARGAARRKPAPKKSSPRSS